MGGEKDFCGERKIPRTLARDLTTSVTRCTEVRELLCLTEDTVDLGTADWADALGHATT